MLSHPREQIGLLVVKATTGGTSKHVATPRLITSMSFRIADDQSTGSVERQGRDDDRGPTRDWPSTLRQIALNLSQSVPPLIYLWLAVRR
jgi:hypothetical protein